MQKQLEDRAYASFFTRLIAFLVDSILIFIVLGVVKIPLYIASLSGLDFLLKDFIFQYSLMDILSYIGVTLYFTLFTYYSHTTIGKMLLGLEVISEDGEWTFINILYRETIGRFLSSLLFLGYFYILADKKHRGFHDLLCNTFVVYKNLSPRNTVEIVEELQCDNPSQIESL